MARRAGPVTRGVVRGVLRGLSVLREGVESLARATGGERHVALAELDSPWLELRVDDFVPPPPYVADPPRIALQLGWTAPVAPPCTCPIEALTATVTGARLLRVARGGLYVSTTGEVPIPTLRCATTMTFWFEPLPDWPALAEVRAAVGDGATTFAFTALRPGVRGGLRLVEPAAGLLPRGGWIGLAATVEGHVPGEIRRLRLDLPGAPPQFHGPAGFDVEYVEELVRLRLPPAWVGAGTLTIDAAMNARIRTAAGARVQRARSSWMTPQVFAVEIG